MGIEAKDESVLKALDLAQQNGLDAVGIIEAAAMLHDVLDHKYVDRNTEAGKDLANEVNKFLGRVFARNIHNAQAVRDIMPAISYSRENRAISAGEQRPWCAIAEPVRTLRHFVSDADKIEALGDGGLARCFEYARELKPYASNEVIEADVRQHCREKLLRLLPFFIQTQSGKLVAQPGHDLIENWYSQKLQNLHESGVAS